MQYNQYHWGSGSSSGSSSCSCSHCSHDNHHDHRESECFVQHIPELNINQSGPIPTIPTPIFKDFTQNHFKLLVRIDAFATSSSASAVIIFTPRSGPSFSEPLVGGVLQVTRIVRLFEVEDIAKIEIQASSATAADSTFLIDGDIWKTFCICCDDKSC